MAGTGERGHPRGSGDYGGVRGVYRRLRDWEAGAKAIRGLLRVRVWGGWLGGQRMLFIG